MPAPTGTPYTPNQYQPQPTRTTATLDDAGPPPPQPGAVPIPPQQHIAPATALPPPPKPGQAAALREAVTTQPPQMYMSPPQNNYAPTHTTSTTNTPTKAGLGPTTLNFGAVSPVGGGIAPPSHPPGYQQNVMAQEMSSTARASLDANERRESLAGAFGLGGSGTSNLPGAGGSNGSMWDTVKSWGASVGETLAETEKKVWERVNKS